MRFKVLGIITLMIHYLVSQKLREEDPLRVYFENIDWSFISRLTSQFYSKKGMKAFNPMSMYKALLCIYLGEANSERDIATKLRYDVRLQYYCGFDFFDTPEHSSFTVFRQRLGCSVFYEIMHQVIAQAIAVGLVKGLLNTATDSTHIWAYSNKFGFKLCDHKDKSQCDCLRYYTDKDAQWGHKSKTYAFFGYKIHLIVDVESQIPLEVIVTSGQTADNEPANDLLDGALKNHPQAKINSNAMDAGYDDGKIYEHNAQKGIAPIIALNPRNVSDTNSIDHPEVTIDKQGNPHCRKTGYRLIKDGTEPSRNNRQKIVCSPTGCRANCPFRKECCGESTIGKTFYLYPQRELRMLGIIPRGSDQWKLLYNGRTSTERTHSQLKTTKHKLHLPKVRGIENIKIHVFLSICGLIVKTIGLSLANKAL